MNVVLLDNLNFKSPISVHIYSYQKFDGITNMAVDHYLASHLKEIDEPIIRFYGWDPYCISIGYHQSNKNIDEKSLKLDGYDFIRRPTGGRAIFHSEELTYSAIFPKKIISRKELYKFIHIIFLRALNNLGYNARLVSNKDKLPKIIDSAADYPCFTRSAETEVEYNGKKLIGSAQKIYPNGILQHGSILTGKFHENLSRYLIANADEKDAIKEEILSKTIYLNSINNIGTTEKEIGEQVLKQLESHNKISLIFKEFSDGFLIKAKQFYRKEFKNK